MYQRLRDKLMDKASFAMLQAILESDSAMEAKGCIERAADQKGSYLGLMSSVCSRFYNIHT